MPSLFWTQSKPEEIADYLTIFSKFEGRKATLNWYRANREIPILYGDVKLTTRLIWGSKDTAVARAGVEATQAYMKGEYSLIELNAGHTLVQEKFEEVDQVILDHIQRHSIRCES